MRIGFISDIHEDIRNLERAIRLLDTLKVDEMVCLGDIAGYSVPNFRFMETRDSTACIQLIKNRCCKVVPGNHDLFAIRKTPEFRGGFDFGPNWYELDYIKRKERGEDSVWLYEETELSALLSTAERAWLDSLPETDSLHTGKLNLGFTHYVYPGVTGSEVGFVEGKSDFTDHFDWMYQHRFDITFSGHGHVEGLTIASARGFEIHSFGKTIKADHGSAIIGPCVARGNKKTGVMIFESNTSEITALQLPED